MPKTSESVWFEQIDSALISLIQSTVSVYNSQGTLVPVPVKVRKPDEDFKIEEYPCITLYNLYSKRDEIRYYPDKNIVSRDVEHKTLELESSAIPYTLVYQIDFWSKLQIDMNSMTRQWLGSFPDRHFNLDVYDMAGNKRSSNVMLKDDLKKSDLLDGNERLFHSMLTYHIWVELDELPSATVPMVVEVSLKVNKTN